MASVTVTPASAAITVPRVNWHEQSSGRKMVPVAVGASIQTAVNANANYTTFLLAAGTHTNQTVVPKEGQSFVGAVGAIMDGGGVTAQAFAGAGADNVTIRSLTVQNYAPASQDGVIKGLSYSWFWLIEDCEVKDNDEWGITVFTDWIVRNCNIHHNGVLGLGGGGGRSLIEGCEIAFNNTSGADPGWEAGGFKFVWCDGMVIRGNNVHDNIGPGIWLDGHVTGYTIENNTVTDNYGCGIFTEINGVGPGVIRYNTVSGNGFGFTYQVDGAGILVACSKDVEIYGNTVEWNNDGIGGKQTDRGDGLDLMNMRVHDNVIRMNTGDSGLSCTTADATNVLYNWGNLFYDNTYTVGAGCGTTPFYGGPSQYTWVQWQALGQDAGSTYNAAAGAATVAPAAAGLVLSRSAPTVRGASLRVTVASQLSLSAGQAVPVASGQGVTVTPATVRVQVYVESDQDTWAAGDANTGQAAAPLALAAPQAGRSGAASPWSLNQALTLTAPAAALTADAAHGTVTAALTVSAPQAASSTTGDTTALPDTCPVLVSADQAQPAIGVTGVSPAAAGLAVTAPQAGRAGDAAARTPWSGINFETVGCGLHADTVLVAGEVCSTFRFANMPIAQGQTVTSAFLRFQAAGGEMGSGWNSTLWGVAADDPAAPTTYGEWAAQHAAHTAASVEWDSAEGQESYILFDSPDIAAIVQEIVDRPGWVYGNALIIHWDNNGGSLQYVAAIEHPTYLPAQLIVEVAAGSQVDVTVTPATCVFHSHVESAPDTYGSGDANTGQAAALVVLSAPGAGGGTGVTVAPPAAELLVLAEQAITDLTFPTTVILVAAGLTVTADQTFPAVSVMSWGMLIS